MTVTVRIDASPARRWHVDVAESLATMVGAPVNLVMGRADRATYAAVDRLAALEKALLSGVAPGLAPIVEAEVMLTEPRGADVVVDLSSDPVGGWTVFYDDRPGLRAATAQVRAGRFPVVTVRSPDGEVRAVGRPGSEHPGMLGAALSDVLAGAKNLLVRAVSGHSFSPPVPFPSPGVLPTGSQAASAARVVGSAVTQRAYRALSRAPHWRTGWRHLGGPDVIDLGGHPASGWSSLPDDGYHFYADPFLLEREGRVYLFVEDFDHRAGKAVISVVEMDKAGPLGTPRTVLDHDVHLSYPFVLEHEGEVFMVPETSGARTVELYRAVAFPDVWTREAVLLEGVVASDATLFRHDDRWWMTATVQDGGSFSDTLHLWWARDLTGPWTPHVGNPVLVDIASARPAGAVVARDGRLLRPTQDCSQGYGAALNLMEITRLDDDAFEQRLVCRLEPGDLWPGRRIHTLNNAGGFEVVDGSRLALRGNRVRRWVRRRDAGSVTKGGTERQEVDRAGRQ